MGLGEREEKPLSAAERMREAARNAQSDQREESTAPEPQTSATLDDTKKTLAEAKSTLREFNSLKASELKVMGDLSKIQQRINADMESLRAARETLAQKTGSWERSFQEGQADLRRIRKRMRWAGTLGAILVLLGVVMNAYMAFRLHQSEETLEKVLARWESQYLQPMAEAKGRSAQGH